MRLGFKIILGILGVAALVVLGVLLFLTPLRVETNYPGVPVEETGGIAPSLIQGAACETDEQCTYALNAYPILKCISGNCPPEDSPNQPEGGDPTYEWIQGYIPSCINAESINNQNSEGEELQIDEREASCACVPIQSQDGIITSVTGIKICTVVNNESLETQ
jgi:hypothetical protein